MDDGIAMVITYFALTTFVIVGLIVTLVFDGGAVFLIAGLFLLFLILGIIMLTGRGAGLIAGWNTDKNKTVGTLVGSDPPSSLSM